MSLRAEPAGPVPEETARVARAAFPKGNVYMQMRDVLGVIYDDETFSPRFAVRGRPAECPWPGARSGGTLLVDPPRGRVLLFGGEGTDRLADLWQLTASG